MMAFIAGFVIGSMFGAVTMALCAVGGDSPSVPRVIVADEDGLRHGPLHLRELRRADRPVGRVVPPLRRRAGGRMSVTEKAVAQLRAYARYIDEHAENIIGDIDRPNYVTESGIRLSFTLLEHDAVPTIDVTKEYIATNVIEAY